LLLFVYSTHKNYTTTLVLSTVIPRATGTGEHDGATASHYLLKRGQRGHRCPYITIS